MKKIFALNKKVLEQEFKDKEVPPHMIELKGKGKN